MQVKVVVLSPGVLKFSLSVCVSLSKCAYSMNPLSVIGTQHHVGQRRNRLPGYAEYSLSDSNMG